MKIEKLNDNQLRATLSREDLMRRQIQFSEFAYGTDAARSLFNELLRFASYKLGFEVDDSPIMVEATPISPDSIVLLVTKTPYPDELDTRFARFSDAPNVDDYLEYSDEEFLPQEILLDGLTKKATDILDVEAAASDDEAENSSSQNDTGESASQNSTETSGTQNGAGKAAAENRTPKKIGVKKGTASTPKAINANTNDRFTRLFCMETLDEVLAASRVVGPIYHGENSLYHTARGYELIVHMGNHSTRDYNRIINVLSEYGLLIEFTNGTEHYFGEHAKCLVENAALQALAQI